MGSCGGAGAPEGGWPVAGGALAPLPGGSGGGGQWARGEGRTDQATVELWRECPALAKEELARRLRHYLLGMGSGEDGRQEIGPDSWRMLVLAATPTEPRVQDMSDHWLISLCSTLSKWYLRVVTDHGERATKTIHNFAPAAAAAPVDSRHFRPSAPWIPRRSHGVLGRKRHATTTESDNILIQTNILHLFHHPQIFLPGSSLARAGPGRPEC